MRMREFFAVSFRFAPDFVLKDLLRVEPIREDWRPAAYRRARICCIRRLAGDILRRDRRCCALWILSSKSTRRVCLASKTRRFSSGKFSSCSWRRSSASFNARLRRRFSVRRFPNFWNSANVRGLSAPPNTCVTPRRTHSSNCLLFWAANSCARSAFASSDN